MAESQKPPAAPAAVRMLVGQEGPTISRVRGQQLAVGSDVDADEAQRLIDASFAEPV